MQPRNSPDDGWGERPDDRSVGDRIVIVGYDGSAQADDALTLGALLSRRPDTRLVLAHSQRGDEAAPGGRLLYQASQRVPYGVRVETRTLVQHDSPAEALVRLAHEEGADTVVVGSCHHGPLGRVLLGSTGEQMLRDLSCALAVAPRNFAGEVPPRIGVIAVAFDGGPEAQAALAAATEMALALNARIRLLAVAEQPDGDFGAVVEPDAFAEIAANRQEALLNSIEAAVESVPADVSLDWELRTGPPVRVLTESCAEDVDLLVSGSRAHGPVRRALLGSVSTQLMRSCPCPLYVVPRGAVHSSATAAA
jgi:nucleotide-binding universal stress UspA family protein